MPILMSIIIIVAASVRRESSVITVGRVFPIVGLVMTLALVAAVVVTAWQNAELNVRLDQSAVAEGRTIANHVHMAWPEAVSVNYYLAHVSPGKPLRNHGS
jgi:hypothetical protein